MIIALIQDNTNNKEPNKIMDKLLSMRRNHQIFSLYLQIQQYQPSANRTEIMNSAIEKALEGERIDWKALVNSKVPNAYSVTKDTFPEFIQLKVCAEKYQLLREQMKEDFQLQKFSPTPFVVRLVLLNYLQYLTPINTVLSDITGKNKFSSSESTISSLQANEVTGLNNENTTIPTKEALRLNFKKLSYDDKINTIYDMLLDLKFDK